MPLLSSLLARRINCCSIVMARTRRAATISHDADASSTRPAKRAKLDTNEAESSESSKFPERHTSLWKVGAHVSSAGGVENSITNAAAIGANAFGLFVKSQRKWTSPALTKDSIDTFKSRMVEHGYSSDVILPHGSYLINLGNGDVEKRKQSYECFLDDLKRCEQLGLRLYNFHPGSTVGAITVQESIAFIADCINNAHKETKTVTTVLENMAGAGNVVGSDFAHLAQIIELVKDKTRVGVCLDTCHMFAAGYDLRKKEDWDATLQKFDETIGLSYLRGMHLNDSKAAHNSKKDRHENIGIGNIGITAFHHILNDPRVQNIPLVLETPSFEKPLETWAEEIRVLNKLSGLEADAGQEFVMSIRDAVDAAQKTTRKKSTSKAKAKATGGRRKNKKKDDDDDENSEAE